MPSPRARVVAPAFLVPALLLAVLMLVLVGCRAESEGATPTEPPRGEPLHPDLIVIPLADLQVGVSPTGERLLFFSATIANIGDGPLLISGRRDGDGWNLEQRVPYSEGGDEGVPLPYTMIFGGDGHDHWHIVEAARYRLTRLDAPDEHPRFDQKAGFCFFDQAIFDRDLAGDVTTPQHASHECGHEDARTTEMGLSVGWADPYQWFLPGQSVDITDAPDGRYRLEAIVDPDGVLRETTIENNVTWLDFELTTRGEDGLPVVQVLEASAPH